MFHTTSKSAKSLFVKLLPKATAAGILGCVGMLALAGNAHADTVGYDTEGQFGSGSTGSTESVTVGGITVTFNGADFTGVNSVAVPDAHAKFGSFTVSGTGDTSALAGTTFNLELFQTSPTPNNGPKTFLGVITGELVVDSGDSSGDVQVTFTNTPLAISNSGGGVTTYAVRTPANIPGGISGSIAHTGPYMTPLPSASMGGLALLVGTGCVGLLRKRIAM